MGPSFTGEAAQDRDCGDRPSHPGGASSRISPRTEYYAIRRDRTIRDVVGVEFIRQTRTSFAHAENLRPFGKY